MLCAARHESSPAPHHVAGSGPALQPGVKLLWPQAAALEVHQAGTTPIVVRAHLDGLHRGADRGNASAVRQGESGRRRRRRRRQGLAACLLFSPRHHIRMSILSVYRVTEACRVEVVLRTRLCVSPEPVRDALRRHLQDNLRHVSTVLRRSQAPMHAKCSVAAAAAAAVPARWLSLPPLLQDASVTTEMSTGSEYR